MTTTPLRPLHWVLKIGSLKESITFFSNVFNFGVHRHEEFPGGCEATCNGPYEGAWSKTMVGPKPNESSNFALELTYNYGLSQYENGNDLRFIAIHARDYAARAKHHNYPLHPSPDNPNDLLINSPDGYPFKLVNTPFFSNEEFLFVSLHVTNLAKATEFYIEKLKMQEFTDVPGATPGGRVLGFSKAAPKLELVQLPADHKLDHAKAIGRLAVETPPAEPDRLAQRLSAPQILHGPFALPPHNERVVIVKDPDAYEVCFVEKIGYLKCCKAGDPVIDFEARQDKINHIERHAKRQKKIL